MARPRMTPELATDNARKAFQLEVKLQRVKLDMSQKELGEALGISAPQISELMANPDKLSIERMRSIISTLGIDPVTVLRFLGFSDRDLKQLAQNLQVDFSTSVLQFRKCQ